MLTTSILVLMVCVAVCAHGPVFSDNTGKNTIKETTRNTHAILDQVLDELRYLRDEDKNNKDEIKNLKNEDLKNKEENKKNQDEIHSLKDLNKKNINEISTLKDEDQKNKEENQKNKDEIHSLKELNEKNMNEINTLNNRGQTTNSQASVASAAFTAVMDGGFHYPDTGDVIQFNTALLNLGQHYNRLTSVFTCAESGLYLFSVTLYSHSIRSGGIYYDTMSGALMLDGVRVAEVYSYTQDPDHFQAHQSAVTAVVECPKGGSVWVECQASGGQIYGTDTFPTSVFTGFAITYNIHP